MSRQRTSKSKAKETTQAVRAFHGLGREALQLPPGLPLAEQALELGSTPARLAVARRFASPGGGYTEDQLDELCKLIRKHRPSFGTSYLVILLAIKWPRRGEFQEACIEQDWTRRELIAARIMCFVPKSHGGRTPKVTTQTVPVLMQEQGNAFCRLVRRMTRACAGQPTMLDAQSAGLREAVRAADLYMRRVRRAARAQLRATQQAG